ncbi:MAG TPA: NADH-quinone oxidoreductase subunit J [Acidimicrobiia bacterium]|nr:NADH-quinone oxidoreductase subunit J [Acidimicrobiia bacterium]
MVAVIFYLAALTMIVGAVGVITARNPVHSAMFLVMTLMSVAVNYVLLGADLAAAVQVIVYASAIVILFLFVIMLLGVDQRDEFDDRLNHQRLVATTVSVLMAATLLLVGGTKWAQGARSVTGPLEKDNLTNIEVVASTLFTKYVYVFELTSILLVGAVIGAVVLARRATTSMDLIDEDQNDEVIDSSEVAK